MRALAEFIMRGRNQAILAVVVMTFMPLIFSALEVGGIRIFLDLAATVLIGLAAAAVALVTLRRGPEAGLSLVLWGLLPSAIWLVWKDEASPLVIIVGTYLLATILRRTMSWAQTLSVASAAGLLISMLIEWLAPETAELLGSVAGQISEALRDQLGSAAGDIRTDMITELMLGGLVAGHLGSVLTSLAIGRWWQAMLYNPGGFRAEFHQLRMPVFYAGLVIAALLLSEVAETGFVRGLPVLILPFILAGIALIHGVVAKRELGRSWLIAVYSVAFVAGPYLISLLILLAVVDSLVDIRKRVPAKS